ncbi:hypothetical protein [Nocardia sp. NPDC051981]|uniref:hypothetical protein n=1 Tax=Nocardia sp. NPDC051981 TaxID=3155417 RepID=UPI00341E3DBF
MNETRTVPDVELIRVGQWEISTGTWSPGRADLASVVAAFNAGILRKPVIKLGHVDARFEADHDGEPSFGYVDRLRLAEDGDLLLGDLVLPEWLAAALPMHYPDRSVEALQGYEGAGGTVWPLVLTGVALLGATAPGIHSLKSLQDLVAASRITLRPKVSRPGDHQRTVLIAASRRRRAHRKES